LQLLPNCVDMATRHLTCNFGICLDSDTSYYRLQATVRLTICDDRDFCLFLHADFCTQFMFRKGVVALDWNMHQWCLLA